MPCFLRQAAIAARREPLGPFAAVVLCPDEDDDDPHAASATGTINAATIAIALLRHLL
jgi:hypothetical protein